LLTTLAKLLFHYGSMDHDSPASLMEGVDNDFRSIFGATSFMTAMCVALDPATGQAQVVGAGHPSLLVVHRDGTTESIASVAPPLGLIKRAAFTETTIALEPGDAFLLYTDGLFRWTKDKRHQVTPGQLEKVLDHSAPSAEALLKRIVSQTIPDNSAKTVPDDVAAIAVRREDRQ
jgi:serine phosphatase RsbU (regulator of sigma subunit)